MLGFFSNIGWVEILVILAVALLLFGGKKLPELAKGLGKGIREFKKELNSTGNDDDSSKDTEDPYKEEEEETKNDGE